MNAGRMAALVVWGLMATAVAAEPESPKDEDLSKLSPGLLQARLNTEQKRLETIEDELTVLRGELQKARGRQAEVRAKQFDTARVSAVLSKFQRSFNTVTDSTAKGLLPSLGAYQSLEQSAYELSRVTAALLSEDLPRFTGEGQRAALLEEVYGNLRTPELPSWSELQALNFPASHGTSPEVFQRDMKEVVVAASDRVKRLDVDELQRLFDQDRAVVLQAWEEVITRAQASINVREAQLKAATVAIDRISTASDARRIEDIQNDTRMNWAIIFMIGALAWLFIATRLFSPGVQAIIFQQRTLVEMVGMAFLLLTIIILGSNGKIEPAVLGTLLGTVGGYIFGQQVNARQRASNEVQEQAPVVAPTARPGCPGATGGSRAARGGSARAAGGSRAVRGGPARAAGGSRAARGSPARAVGGSPARAAGGPRAAARGGSARAARSVCPGAAGGARAAVHGGAARAVHHGRAGRRASGARRALSGAALLADAAGREARQQLRAAAGGPRARSGDSRGGVTRAAAAREVTPSGLGHGNTARAPTGLFRRQPRKRHPSRGRPRSNTRHANTARAATDLFRSGAARSSVSPASGAQAVWAWASGGASYAGVRSTTFTVSS